MAIQTIEQPNEFNWARQTIPFLVKSNLIGTSTSTIDPIERAFRFVFDVFVQNSNGLYKPYSSISIPPRPDNYYAFFDAAPLVLDAISYDLGTHKLTYASPSNNSIVKFRVFCTERYLDANGNFVSGPKTNIGEYYGIDGAGNEGIAPYLLDNTGTKKPLHHHFLVDQEELVVSQKEPLTLSWLSKNDLGVNELEYIHGNYGSFADSTTVGTASISNVLSPYSGITKNSLTTIVPGANTGQNGSNCIRAYVTGVVGGGNSTMMVWKLTGLDLSPNTAYQFRVRLNTLSPNAGINSNLKVRVQPTGTNFIGLTSSAINVNQLTTSNFTQFIQVTFVTTSLYISGDVQLELQYQSTNAFVPLQTLNGFQIQYDSVTLFETAPSSATAIGDFQIITDAGTTYTLPTGYTQNILPLNDTGQSRFDTPVGPYKQYHPTGQDATTGFWLNSPGVPANWFQLRIRNTSGGIMGLSEKIWQKTYDCDLYDKFRLKWKNSLGGWDYYTFTKVSKARTNIERENFKRSRGTISATKYQELSSDRGYQSLNIKLQDTYTVISDWVGDGTAKWMLDLFTSDEVYLLNPEPFQRYVTTTEYDLEYPVFVQQNDVEFMNNAGDARLKNFVIDITPAIRFEENTTN